MSTEDHTEDNGVPAGVTELSAAHGQALDQESAQPAVGSLTRILPEATLARLTQYLRALIKLKASGELRTSSGVLATAAGVNPAILRKDLSLLGSYGTRGVGYVVVELTEHISKALGLLQQWRVAIIGAGNLGRALSGYGGFRSRGFEIVALLDAAPEVIGTTVGDMEVQDIADLENIVQLSKANMAVLSVPGISAQDLCDKLVDCGVRSILSFAPVVLNVPAGVNLRRVDLATELQILAYHAQNLEA
ncbi:redox-sensing transcriptional repressor Rex [Paeniglutamicibacter sp. Y32M11]|uniref:redox-sensing transcriptional repressor Rex n=1 Tax=Paeniglutamicibacter sp. Y32M11 TaxID=2853258 RepID=UPI001C52E163|nr:redox-sensing transcriptional repressor Rex [Paeniglutamicibacter sp. Y32M11]QXQ09432.1 redox-sensing transcriptional repressor Rex [Paeniglutamicibacter sp. Y32M11]